MDNIPKEENGNSYDDINATDGSLLGNYSSADVNAYDKIHKDGKYHSIHFQLQAPSTLSKLLTI